MKILVLICIYVLAPMSLLAGDHYIVRLKDKARPLPQWAKASSLIPTLDLSIKKAEQTLSSDQKTATDVLRRYVIVEINNDAELALLRNNDDVELITPNRRISIHEENLTNDSLSGEQYALQKIGAQTAWKKTSGSGVVVGVVDTGIDWEHIDLRDRLAISVMEDINFTGRFEPWSHAVEVDGVTGDLNNIDDDENGYVDDVIGFDFVDQDVRNIGDDRTRDAIPFDEQGHGTSVAGVVCAQANNSVGIAGLAYDSRVVSIRAFDATGNAEEDDIAAAIVYAAVNRVDVVNMSFGDGVDSPVLRDAIRFAAAYGCVLVSSAGNTGGSSRQFPAGYDDVIAVAATNEFNERAPFSSTGSLVDLCAPGEAIITTRAGGGYRKVNGTSFSAPYVAASIALLIEQRGSLGGNVFRSMLQESSLDLGDRGWDPLFGAGLLQIDMALDLPGQSLIEITSPLNEQEVSTSIGSIEVRGSTQALMFDSYRIEIGKGADPVVWTTVSTSLNAVSKSILAQIDVSALSTSDYVVRLIVVLKDGRSLEERKRIRVVDNDTLRITYSEVISAWNNDRRVVVLSITTSRPSYLEVVADLGGTMKDTTTDAKRFSGRHSVTLDPSPWATSGTLHVRAISGNGDSVIGDYEFDIGNEAMPSTGATVKTSAPFAGYVLNDVRDVYNTGDETFVMNDLSSGGFGPMLTVQKDGLNWGYQDSTSDVWIPRGMGDADGDGKLEVFAHVVGKARLFEASSVGGNPFESTIYLDDAGRNNAAGMADIDGDGREELLTLSDSGCVVTTFRNGRFERLGIVPNLTEPAPGNLNNRIDEVSIATGDFDGDGHIELAFSDTDGDLIIGQYANSEFTVEYVLESDGAGGSGYVVGGDVDNDGKDDLLLGVPDSTEPGPNGEYGRQVWTYRLFKSSKADSYSTVWIDRVHGVRYGLGYRSGVEIGQVDMKAGNEIIICAFPRLFVFRWKDDRLQPFYYRDDVVSPRFLIHDFDKNGHNELGFGKTELGLGYMTAFQFIEIDEDETRIATPTGINAVSIDSNSAFVSWMAVPGATGYRVFSATDDDGLFRAMDTVAAPSITIDTLNASSSYSFRVSALSDVLKESLRSAIVTINVGAQHRPIRIEENGWSKSEFAKGIQFRVVYNTAISTSNIDPTSFVVTDSAGTPVSIGRTATCASDTDVVVTCMPLRFAYSSNTCHLIVGSIADGRGIPTIAATFEIPIYNDSTPNEIYLSRLDVKSDQEAHVVYSKEVGETATQASNYTLTPAGVIASVERINETTVSILFRSDPPLAALGTQYSITARNIVSVEGDPITLGVGNTLSFVFTASDLENVFVYPQPALLSTHDHLTFANLTQQAEIEVLDQRFMTIARIKEIDGNGGARWDMRDGSGNLVPAGMYFYRVSGMDQNSADFESGLRKFMIRR